MSAVRWITVTVLAAFLLTAAQAPAEDAQQIAQLIGKLAAAEDKPRSETIAALARYGAKAHDQVCNALGSADGKVRSGASQVFRAWSRDAAAMDMLARAYAEGDANRAAGAKEALEGVGLPGVDCLSEPQKQGNEITSPARKALAVALAACLRERDAKAREANLRQLAYRTHLVPILLDMFPGAAPDDRASLVEVIAAMAVHGGKTLVLIGEALNHRDASVASGARDALARSGEGVFLLKASGKSCTYYGQVPNLTENGRRLAGEALDAMPPFLLSRLRDPNEHVRRAAGDLLTKIGVASVKPLVGMLTGEDARASEAARLALVELGGLAVPELMAAASGTDGQAAAARKTLVEIGWPALAELQKSTAAWAREIEVSASVRMASLSEWYAGLETARENIRIAFKKALKGERDEKERSHAAQQDRAEVAIALGEMGDPVSVPELASTLSDKGADVNLRWRCAWALTMNGKGSAAAVAALLEALKDQHGEVRRASALALGRIGDKSQLDALYEAYRAGGAGGNRGVRAACRWALEQLAGERLGENDGAWAEFFKKRTEAKK